MAVIQFRSPVTKLLLRADQPLPADRTSVFRVTQRFDSRDFYWNDGRTHSATDIGDFGCGAPLVAMADGIAYRVKDNASQIQAGATDALGVRIDHGEIAPGVRITTEIWHMGGWTVNDGQRVTAGQQIGIVGNTGLGAVCHAHVEAKRNGVKFDPEPLMFGGRLGEGGPMFDPGSVVDLYGTLITALPTANIREGPTTASRLLGNYPDGYSPLRAVIKVRGQLVNGSDVWWGLWLNPADKTLIAYAHSSAIQVIPIPPTGITQAELKAARDAGFADAKAKSKSASSGAIEGITP